MRNQLSALSQVCTNTDKKKPAIRGHRRGKRAQKLGKKGKQGGEEGKENRLEQLQCGKKRKLIKNILDGRNITLLLLVRIRRNIRSLAYEIFDFYLLKVIPILWFRVLGLTKGAGWWHHLPILLGTLYYKTSSVLAYDASQN